MANIHLITELKTSRNKWIPIKESCFDLCDGITEDDFYQIDIYDHMITKDYNFSFIEDDLSFKVLTDEISTLRGVPVDASKYFLKMCEMKGYYHSFIYLKELSKWKKRKSSKKESVTKLITINEFEKMTKDEEYIPRTLHVEKLADTFQIVIDEKKAKEILSQETVQTDVNVIVNYEKTMDKLCPSLISYIETLEKMAEDFFLCNNCVRIVFFFK